MGSNDSDSTKMSVRLPLDRVGPMPENYTPEIGEQALEQLKPKLVALPEEVVAPPNSDSAMAGLVALQMIRNAEAGDRMQQLRALPPSLLPVDAFEVLQWSVWALWYLQSRVQSFTATSGGARVPADVVKKGAETRARMMRVLGYHLFDNPLMQAELADIALGSGYQDLASDLTRLASHYTFHKTELEGDTKQYDPADDARARGLANQIYVSLQPQAEHAVIDLRNRVWTLLSTTYAQIKACADLIFRGQPRVLELFPAMRAMVLAMSTKRRASGEEEPVDPTGGTAPVALGSPAVPPVPPVGTTPPAAGAATAPATTVSPVPGAPSGPLVD